MLEKNGNLPLIPRHHKRLPVHLDTLSSCHRIMQGLSSGNLLDRMTYKNIEFLFFMTISSSMYGKTNRKYHTYLPPRNIATNIFIGIYLGPSLDNSCICMMVYISICCFNLFGLLYLILYIKSITHFFGICASN